MLAIPARLKPYIGSRNFYRQALTVMIPVVIQQLINTLFNVVDNVMVGGIGALAMSAVTAANKPYLIYNGFFFGMAGAGGLLISQYYGAKERDTCQGLFALQLVLGLISSLLSILFAFLIGAGILAVSGFHPLEAYGAMLSGAFDSARHIGDFLEYAMVLCVCGLACVLGARVGIFNVGGEGQLLLGAIFAAQVGVWMDGQPRFLVIICAALAAMAVGGLYAFLPGVLKVKVKVNEVITTIMLNTIAAYLCQYLAKGPWKNANKNMVAATEQLGAQYWFGNVIPRSNLTSAVFAAAVMAFLVWYVMERTSVGYEMRITGENPRFAFFSGLRTDQIVLLSMVVSGAMCGLVGMFRVYGVEHLYRDSVSKDYYFEALMVAMIAQYKPVTVILLSLFFAVLKIGAQGMELIGIPSQIYLIIQTVIIFCMAAESGITRSLTAAHERRRAKRAAEERLKEELKHG